MIPKECKRLAEVDFPIAVVSKHAAREKSIRHGHPSTLHLWWARRPLAACRAMLLALLLPDPADEHCPEEFRTKARDLLAPMGGKIGRENEDLRQAILRFIGEVADWNVSNNAAYLDVARGLVKAAHPEETPLVVDPFAGGGAIPLEALRVGCDAFASDLNPVSCLINKVMLEDIPRRGRDLAEKVRRTGAEIKAVAEKELARFYPRDRDGGRPIAYIWARTVRCESPNCGAEIPLVRSFWLCKKASRKRTLRYRVVQPEDSPPNLEFALFEPETERDVPSGTVSGGKAKCPCCEARGQTSGLSADRVRAQLADQHGGSDVMFDAKGNRLGGATLLAVVTLQPGEPGRQYRLPTPNDYQGVFLAARTLGAENENTHHSCSVDQHVPSETVNPVRPSPNARGLSAVTRFGMSTFRDLFTQRQLASVLRFCHCVREIEDPHIQRLIAFALSKLIDLCCSLCRWEPIAECPRQFFTRHAAAITWDFAEGVPISSSSGGFGVCVENVLTGLASLSSITSAGTVTLADAADTRLPSDSVAIWFTDPPYYDAIPYADLADFFFVWLKRSLRNESLLRDPFDSSNPLTPKTQECVWNQGHKFDGVPKDGTFFEVAIERCFCEARRFLREDGVGGVVFAHRTTEGWEALLNGLISAGWTITGSWPIATEMASRIRARNTAALATSVHLVCRPRAENALVGDWVDVLRELPPRVADWMDRLQSEGVRGADLVFACIGPALEIFSRYTRVETAEGREVPLAEYLEKVWEVVGRSALQQVLGTAEGSVTNGTTAAALEEDARLTALFLWTMQSTELGASNGNGEESTGPDLEEDETPKSKGKGFSLPFDVVRRFAQPLGIHLPDWEARIIQTEKGIVRLIPVLDRGEQLFGEEGATAVADELEQSGGRSGLAQLSLFPDEIPQPPQRRGRRKKGTIDVSDEQLQSRREATTLDRVHAAMLFQASGRSSALRALLQTEINRSPDFLRLANALSALYPKGSDEKRLLDAMLLAVPR